MALCPIKFCHLPNDSIKRQLKPNIDSIDSILIIFLSFSLTTNQRVTSSSSTASWRSADRTCCASRNRVTSCRRSASWIRWKPITKVRWADGRAVSIHFAAAIPVWLRSWRNVKLLPSTADNAMSDGTNKFFYNWVSLMGFLIGTPHGHTFQYSFFDWPLLFGLDFLGVSNGYVLNFFDFFASHLIFIHLLPPAVNIYNSQPLFRLSYSFSLSIYVCVCGIHYICPPFLLSPSAWITSFQTLNWYQM